jgi:hypothetical protein
METNKKGKCGVCEIPHFRRNNYFYGKLLTARDFKDEQCYFNEKRWLINRMIHGWGVVCGLDVHFEDFGEECIQQDSSCEKKKRCKIVIEPGLAIDCCGREILVCEKQVITLDDVEPSCNPESEKHSHGKRKYVICLEYDECKTESVTVAPSMCGQSEKTKFNRIQDHFKIRLRHASDICDEGYQREFCQLSDRQYSEQNQSGSAYNQDLKQNCAQYETLNYYLCEKLREGCPDCAYESCLVLADITAEPLGFSSDSPSQDDGQQEPQQQEQGERPHKPRIRIRIDPCSRRRLVYNNKMLFDLIHCFHEDLPHIIGISWEDCHGKMNLGWDAFEEKIIKGGLTVTFDHEMDPETINRHTFFISFKFGDRPSGTIVQKFIPIDGISHAANHCTFKLSISKDWIEEEIEASKSELFDGIDVEITLRSSHILDKDGKALDGDFIGGKLPSGNGTQGGDYLSWFSVLEKGAESSQKPDQNSAKLYATDKIA